MPVAQTDEGIPSGNSFICWGGFRANKFTNFEEQTGMGVRRNFSTGGTFYTPAAPPPPTTKFISILFYKFFEDFFS